MSDDSLPVVSGVVRAGEWREWQVSHQAGQWTDAGISRVLARAKLQWREERARFDAALQSDRARHEAELVQLRQTALDQAHAEAHQTWGEQLAAWRLERRSALLSLREDVVALVCEVMKHLWQDLPMASRLALVLDQLDPLIEQRHAVQFHVAPAELVTAQHAMQTCWSEAVWNAAAPRIMADPTVPSGQLRAVTNAGVLVLDWAQQLAHFQRHALGVEPGRRT